MAGVQLGIQMPHPAEDNVCLETKQGLVLTLMAFSVSLSAKIKVYSGAFRSY